MIAMFWKYSDNKIIDLNDNFVVTVTNNTYGVMEYG